MLKPIKFFNRGQIFFQTFLFLVFITLLTLISLFRQEQLYRALPLVYSSAVVSQVSPSPLPKLSNPKTAIIPSNSVTNNKTGKTLLDKEVLGSSNLNTLCKGEKNSWTMVPDPSHEGLYAICNVAKEKMATVDELNSAQNDYRRSHGLNALTINSGLCRIAGERAQEISKSFSHDGFEAAIKRSGLDKHSFGENIASGPLDAVHFVQWSWDRSPGHKANMLGDWTDGCAGVSGKYAVFLFAK